MHPWITPILIFLSAGLFAWGLALVVLGYFDQDRRRLKQRLAGNQPQGARGQEVRVVLQQQDQGALGEILGQYHFFSELRSTLKQSVPDVTLERYLMISAGVTLIAFIGGFTLTGSLIGGGVAAIVGVYCPFLVVARKKMRRQKLLAEQLPDGLDFLGRSLRAGHSLPIGLQMLGSEMPAPLSEEFGRCSDAIALGCSPEEALKAMTERIDSTDFSFFVTAVLVQKQTGGDLAQVLDNITGMLRQRIQLQQQVKAKTAEGRFTGYILAAFPMVMFLILFMLNRKYAELLVTTSIGQTMLAAALLLSGTGLYVIRKITTVRV